MTDTLTDVQIVALLGIALATAGVAIWLLWASRNFWWAQYRRVAMQLSRVQDDFPSFALCPTCGSMVRMTGWACKVGICDVCESAVGESDAAWIDPVTLCNNLRGQLETMQHQCRYANPDDGCCVHPAAATAECHPDADCPPIDHRKSEQAHEQTATEG